MSAQLSSRERILATLVGTVLLVLVNVFLISYFLKNHSRLQKEKLTKTAQLQAMQALFADRALWAERDAWLKQKQEKLGSEATAAKQLIEEVQRLAKQVDVQALTPQMGSAERRPQYVSIPVTIETKSSLPALYKFLYEMQSPERFIVFESLNLEIDQEDKTLMRGKFRIAKWFAPK